MATTGLWLWKFAKLGAVGGAVYFTVVNGVWSRDTKQVQNLVEQIRGPVEEAEEQKEKDKLWIEDRRNNDIQRFFKWMSDSPEKAKEMTQKAISKTKDLIKS